MTLSSMNQRWPTLYYLPYIPSLSQSELIYRPHHRTVTRLATYPDAPHHQIRVRVRPSIILKELDRIQYRKRPNFSISAVDDFYRDASTKLFEDESRRIRADLASSLSRCRSVVPRAASVAPLDTIYSYRYGEPLVPFRFSNDAYIAGLRVPLNAVRRDINHISYYHRPAERFTGKGHLACLHYSGSKGFSNRRPLYNHLSIRDDVNLLSFYAKNRLAASGLAVESSTVKLLPWRPSRKFQPMQTMDDCSEELKTMKADREARFRAATLEPDFAPQAAQIDLAELKKKRQEEARAAEERALKEEAKRDAERKAQADREAVEKKKSEDEARRKAEDEARKAEEEANKAEEARLAQEAAEESARKAEEEKLAEEARQAEEARIADARKVEEERQAEEARLAAEAKAAEAAKAAEEEARLAEEAKSAEEARLAEESRLAQEEEERQAEQRRQEELAKLEELEKQAEEEQEAELARQAAELAEIARQESELAAARLEELSRSGSAADNLDADASEPQEEVEPVIEEPESPDAPTEDEPAADDAAAEVSEDEQAEPDVTDEE